MDPKEYWAKRVLFESAEARWSHNQARLYVPCCVSGGMSVHAADLVEVKQDLVDDSDWTGEQQLDKLRW